MAEPLSHCPNCGTAWPEGADVCPHCGYLRQAAPAWPPPPTNFGATPPAPPPPRLLTGAVWGDLTLGIGITVVSCCLYCLGFLVMPILWAVFQPKYPLFTRGIGYGLLGGAALLLGACALCFYDLSKGNL